MAGDEPLSALLRRLLRAVAAYQVADLVSKLIAVVLLPLYTHYIAPGGYGEVELLATGVIFLSILVRCGMIEAFLRFHFTDASPARRAALARRATVFLLITTTIAAAVLAAVSAPASRLVLGHRDTTFFLIAVLGLWSFTNLELAYGRLRVEERIRAYTVASLVNVGLTIAASVVLVVVLGQGARGLLLGNYAVSTLVLLGLWWTLRDRLRTPGRVEAAKPLRELLRFGLPTVPAELSVYALSIVDRYYVYHQRSAALAGLYSIALKLAGSVAFIVRAFQYAWPPLAYSISDDAQASRFYGLITTGYVLISGWVVAGLALLGHWLLALLTSRSAYLDAYPALPWVGLGWAMYGLWVVFLVIAGRVGATRRNFPAAFAGLVVNVVLLVVLVGPLGIAGAGVALCGAYLAMLVVMHLLTRRAFPVEFEWRRLARAVVVIGGLTVAGVLLLPGHGAAGLLSRLAVLAAIPLVLALTGFASEGERAAVRRLALAVRGGDAA